MEGSLDENPPGLEAIGSGGLESLDLFFCYFCQARVSRLSGEGLLDAPELLREEAKGGPWRSGLVCSGVFCLPEKRRIRMFFVEN